MQQLFPFLRRRGWGKRCISNVKIKVSHRADASDLFLYDKKRFTEIFQVEYLSSLVFDSWEVERDIRKKCEQAHKKGNIGQLALWLGQLHEKTLKEELFPSLHLRWIDEKIGYGLFADDFIQPWQCVGEYAGLVRRRNLFFRNINDYCFMYPKEWRSFKAYTIDSAKKGNFTRFINHSDTPNCESVAVYYDGVFHILFRALKVIAPGEQLTYDYGSIYWQRRKKLTT